MLLDEAAERVEGSAAETSVTVPKARADRRDRTFYW